MTTWEKLMLKHSLRQTTILTCILAYLSTKRDDLKAEILVLGKEISELETETKKEIEE